jgi:hypothetical protein
MRYPQIGTRVSPEFLAVLRQAAVAEDRSVADIMSIAIRDWLAARGYSSPTRRTADRARHAAVGATA